MCGIIGIIDHSGKPIEETELIRSRDLVSHRGPDGVGIWADKNIGFGHRRLSIVGLGDKGNQPMVYQHLVIIHNGEIYNYLELRDLLKKKGFQFKTTTDTEVLGAAYCHWGSDCVEHLIGMWAFAIYDRQKCEVFCSRDRFGIKPFYYTQIGHKFCFASEIKQFTAFAGWKPQIHEANCREWLQTGSYNRYEETLFASVKQLPAGHNLVIRTAYDSIRIKSYYELNEKISPSSLDLSFPEAKEHFRKLFHDAVRLHLRADVSTGLTLSGGLDSSALAAIISRQFVHKSNLATFSACFSETGYNEEPYIDAMAHRYSLHTHKIHPNPAELLNLWKTVTWYMDEPLSNLSDLSHFLLFKRIKSRELKVILCGQGADEILAGYNTFYLPYWKRLAQQNPLHAVFEAVQFAVHHPQTLQKRITNRQEKKHLSTLTTTAKGNSITGLQATSLKLIQQTVLPFILHSEDRLSMSQGVESRVPFLDHRLVEFCLSLPDEFKIKSGIRKRLLREAMRPELPDIIYRRYDKIGFETPISQVVSDWLKQKLISLDEVSLPKDIKAFNGKTTSELWRKVGLLGWWRIFGEE